MTDFPSNSFGENYVENSEPDATNNGDLSGRSTGAGIEEDMVATAPRAPTAAVSGSASDSPSVQHAGSVQHELDHATSSSDAAGKGSLTAPVQNTEAEGDSPASSAASPAAEASLPSYSIAPPMQVPAADRPMHSGIRKEKIYTDGAVKYGFLTASGVPQCLDEALHDKNWKTAMDIEYMALMKNKTWHLIPP